MTKIALVWLMRLNRLHPGSASSGLLAMIGFVEARVHSRHCTRGYNAELPCGRGLALANANAESLLRLSKIAQVRRCLVFSGGHQEAVRAEHLILVSDGDMIIALPQFSSLQVD
jgi:hypothetical protein